MMKKLKAAGVLVALTLAAVTLLNTVPASGDSGFLITSMVSRLKRYCGTGQYRDACRYIANVIVPARPILAELQNGDPIPPAKQEAFLRIALARMGRVVGPEKTCDGCVQKVQNFESLLATNGTSLNIVDLMDDACTARFRNDPTRAAQCAGEVAATVPQLIDLLLANLPPLTACSSGKRRPMNYCAAP